MTKDKIRELREKYGGYGVEQLRAMDTRNKAEIAELEPRLNAGTLSAAEEEHLTEIMDVVEYLSMPADNSSPPGLEQPGIGTQGFRSLGEQLQSVVAASIQGGRVDPRLSENRATGLGGAVPSEGGFLLQMDYSSQLIGSIFTNDSIPGRVRRFPIRKDASSLTIPGIDETDRTTTRFGGVLAYWLAEAGTKTASKPKFRAMEFTPSKLIGLCYVTDELLGNVAALESYVREAFRQEFNFRISKAIIAGTGSGQPLGITASNALIAQSKEDGQTADTLVYDNVVNMVSRLQPMNESSVVWIANRDVLPQLWTMSLSVGAGGVPVYSPADGKGKPNTLMGYPIIWAEASPTLGDANDLMLCDLSAYGLVDKGDIQYASSIHVQFVTDETALRFVYQVAGQPLLESAVTPENSTTTLSPFVGLAERA